MVYRLVFTQRAVRDLETLDPQARRRIGQALARYQQMPLQFARQMAAPSLGDYRFRIGDYRVIFDLDGDAIVVLRVGHRSQIYRR